MQALMGFLHSLPVTAFFTVAIGFPLGMTLAMNYLESVIEQLLPFRRPMKVGWDLCVLSMGAAGPIAMDSDVNQIIGPTWALAALGASFVWSLVMSTAIAKLRARPQNAVNKWHARRALALGGLAMLVPAFLAVIRP
jgi:hypothetical protein